MILVDQLKKILEEHPTSNVQLLLCDFNSLPESGVIEYIENGEISKSMSFVMSLIKIIF